MTCPRFEEEDEFLIFTFIMCRGKIFESRVILVNQVKTHQLTLYVFWYFFIFIFLYKNIKNIIYTIQPEYLKKKMLIKWPNVGEGGSVPTKIFARFARKNFFQRVLTLVFWKFSHFFQRLLPWFFENFRALRVWKFFSQGYLLPWFFENFRALRVQK